MIPERIAPDSNLEAMCRLAARWKIHPDLAFRLFVMAGHLEIPMTIISGYRSAEKQRGLLARPDSMAAPIDRSTHTTCPATGADMRLGVAVTNVTKARFGTAARLAGLRWGGGSPVDPDTGIPADWNHVDLGPRAP